MRYLVAILAHIIIRGWRDAVQANLVTDEAALWPHHVVPFEYGDTLGDEQRQQLKNLFFLFHSQTCIRFVPHRREGDYIVIEQDEFRTLSPHLGRRGGRQVLTFTPKDFEGKRAILRELMRTLGFFYEVQRPDRFMFVDVHIRDISTKVWSKFRTTEEMRINLLGESYDYNSATHFAPEEYAFGSVPAFTILAPNQATGQDVGLSETDVRRLNKAYKCGLLVADNTLCPDKWISGQDGRCYYFSFLDVNGRSMQGPGRQSCERLLSIPMVMAELSISTRSFVLDVLRQTRSEPVWVTGTSPMRELHAERDNRCSILDTMNNVRSLDDGVPCEGVFRNFTCQRTAANECWYVRDNDFQTYPDCIRR